MASPELINDGQHTAPSKRIISLIPAYADEKMRLVRSLPPRSAYPRFGRSALILGSLAEFVGEKWP